MSGKFNVRGFWWRHYLPMSAMTVFLLLPTSRRMFSSSGWRWAYILVLAFSLCFCLTPVFRRLAYRFNVLDCPDARKVHGRCTPLLGGGAVFGAFLTAMLANGIINFALGVIIGAATVLFVVGMMDDILELPAGGKLVAQIGAAIAVMLAGVTLNVVPRSLGPITLIGNLSLTLIWIIGITNAMNFFDGMDGMAAGLGAIISFFLGVVAFQTEQPLLGWVAVGMMGSCIGFLPYNLMKAGPATIFLGDAGSTVIGFILACLAVYGHWAKADPVGALAPPILIFWILIFDMVHITVDRIILGKVRNFRQWVEYVGRDHLHHRIEAVVGGPKRSVLFIYMLAVCMGISAVVLINAGTIDMLLLILQAVVIVVLITVLERRGRALSVEGSDDCGDPESD